MEIMNIKTEHLVPYDKNTKKHDKTQINNRDYNKYLKKLYKRLRVEANG